MIEWLKKYYAFLVIGIFGILIFLLKRQGSKLHAAQVELLRIRFKTAFHKQDRKVKRIRERYYKALSQYKKSKKS